MVEGAPSEPLEESWAILVPLYRAQAARQRALDALGGIPPREFVVVDGCGVCELLAVPLDGASMIVRHPGESEPIEVRSIMTRLATDDEVCAFFDADQ